MGGDEHNNDDALFNVAIAVIFAREFLEGAIIIGNYRTVIIKNEDLDEETKKAALKNVTISASVACIVAVLVVIAVAIPLAVLSKELNDETIEIIEGTSKIVASICILQLSVKIPVWLGLYWKVSILPWKNKEVKKPEVATITVSEIRFNVAWNIWREVAECGVFLIPFFLGTGAKAIPLSALLGIAVALVLGIGMYIANHRLKSKVWLSFFMSGLTLMLAVGLFVGGCHEFEEVFGETRVVYDIENPRLSSSEFPMVLLKPFGYSSERTVLQICAFWLFLALGLLCHYLKYHNTQVAKAKYAEAYPDEPEVQKDVESAMEPTEDLAKSDGGSSEGKLQQLTEEQNLNSEYTEEAAA